MYELPLHAVVYDYETGKHGVIVDRVPTFGDPLPGQEIVVEVLWEPLKSGQRTRIAESAFTMPQFKVVPSA